MLLLQKHGDESVNCFISAVSSSGDPEEPKKFSEAWNHPDPVMREKWREAIKKEFGDMTIRSVWKVVPLKSIPKDRHLIGCKFVFKIKRDGRCRARLCAQGFTQIPGVDFTESYAPVINNVTFKII